MVEKLYGDVSIDICTECNGVWLDDGELRRIIRQYEKGARGDKIISSQLAQGFSGGSQQRPSLSDVVKVIMAFFGKG